MLKMMRAGTQSILLKSILFGILLLATVGLSLFGVQDIFRHGLHAQTVASIGHDDITKQEFDRILQDQLRQQKITQEEAYKKGIPEETLQREVNSRVFVRAASDLGLIVDDATVRKQLQEVLAPMVKNGLTEQQALKELTYHFNKSEGQIVASIKSEIAVNKLTHALSDGAEAPKQMINDFLKYKYEWRRGEYFQLGAADAAAKEPTDDELKEYYKTMQSHYMQHEYRSFSALVINKKSLGTEEKEASDAKAYYDAHKDMFTEPEKRVVSQIAVGDEELAKELDAKAAKEKDLKKLADAAPKGKAQFITGSYSKAEFIPAELADEVFKAAAGTVLPPLKGPFGWQVVRVEKITPSSVKTFDEAKPDIEKALASGSAGEALYARSNEIDDMIGGGKTLAEVAQHFNMKELNFDKVDAQGLDTLGKPADQQGLPVANKVLAAVFSLDKGATTQMIQAPDGSFVVAEVHDIIPAQVKPFDSVRADVVTAWKEHQAGDILDKKAAKIIERLKMGEDFAKIAAENGKTIQKTDLISRDSMPGKAKSVDPAIISALFNLDKVGQTTAVPAPGAVTLLLLDESRIEMPKEPKKEDISSLEIMLNNALQTDILEQFRRSLLAKYDVRMDMDMVKAMYAPKGDEDNGQ